MVTGRFFEPVGGSKKPLRLGIEWPSHADAVARASSTGHEYMSEWHMSRHIGWEDPVYGVDFTGPVTSGGEQYFTDLASTPSWMTWLVPAQGVHFPAILFHDALVVGPDSERTHDGPPVSRIEADQIMRDGMRVLGTKLTRRWLAWLGAVVATLFTGMARCQWFWRFLALFMLVPIVVLGLASSVHFFGWADLVPWLGDRSLVGQLLVGLAVLVAYAAAHSVLWTFVEWRRREQEEAAWWGSETRPSTARKWQLGRWAFLTCLTLSLVVAPVVAILAIRAGAWIVDLALRRLSVRRDMFQQMQEDLAP